ncbi:MAG TPA: hypothetical protein VH142_11875 [Polyangiaceae bacterium]|nr:hypothetical protein [Polyangiaceae bacterium]
MPHPDVVSPPRPAPAFDRACRALAFAAPLVMSGYWVRSAAAWRDDLSLVGGLGFIPFGGEHGPSAFLSVLFALLPVGGRVLRAGLVAVLGAGVAGACLYSIARTLLAKSGASPRFAAWLALACSLATTLSPLFQAEASSASGATLATGFALAVLASRERLDRDNGTRSFAMGALFGLCAAESRLTAAVVALSLVARAIVERRSAADLRDAEPRREVLAAAAGALTTWGFFMIPALLRPLGAHGSNDLGMSLFDASAPLARNAVNAAPVLDAWAGEVGPFALALVALGVVRIVMKRPVRDAFAPLAVFVAAAALVAPRPEIDLARDAHASISLLATAALSLAAALGVHGASLALRRSRLPFAPAATVLLVVLYSTLVFAAVEASTTDPARSFDLGTAAWTDEAFGELPPNALVLVRSRALALRFWSARMARGERPDVVVVPLELIGKGSVARRLVEQEPALAPLVRDVAMTGKTTEYSLSALADARAFYVELDPTWDKHLFEHLKPSGLWLGFAAHPLGRSDRTAALASDDRRRIIHRIVGGRDDPATESVLSNAVREQALVLAALGDVDSARRALEDLNRLDPASAFSVKLGLELDTHAKVDPIALLE